jgi:hypothetical protein
MERQSRACYVRCGSKTRTRMGVGQADARRALNGARGFLETGVDAPAITGHERRLPSRTAFSYTLTSLIGGGCQLPLGARRGSREPSATSARAPRGPARQQVYGCGNRRRPPEKGLFERGFLVPRVVIVAGSWPYGVRHGRAGPTGAQGEARRDAPAMLGSSAGAPMCLSQRGASARVAPAKLRRISGERTAKDAGLAPPCPIGRRRWWLLASHSGFCICAPFGRAWAQSRARVRDRSRPRVPSGHRVA